MPNAPMTKQFTRKWIGRGLCGLGLLTAPLAYGQEAAPAAPAPAPAVTTAPAAPAAPDTAAELKRLAAEVEKLKAQQAKPAEAPAATSETKVDDFFKPVVLGKDALILGGYLQTGYNYNANTNFNNDDHDGFVITNARITGNGGYAVNSWFGVEYKFNFDVSQGNFLVRDVAGSLVFLNRALVLDVGQFKVPYTYLEQINEATLQFAMPTQISKLSYGRDRGAQLRGDIAIPGAPTHIAYWAGIFNGEGQNAPANSDDHYLYAGRLEVSPLGNVAPGEADLDDSPIRFALGGSAAYSPKVDRKDLGNSDAGAREARWSADARLKFKGLSFRAEYLGAHVNLKGNANNPDNGISDTFNRYAVLAQIGYVLPLPWFSWPQFEPVIRYDQMDLNTKQSGVIVTDGTKNYSVPDNTAIRHLDFGLNAYILKQRVKLGFLYRMSDYLEGPKKDVNGDVLIGDSWWLMMQIGWL